MTWSRTFEPAPRPLPSACSESPWNRHGSVVGASGRVHGRWRGGPGSSHISVLWTIRAGRRQHEQEHEPARFVYSYVQCRVIICKYVRHIPRTPQHPSQAHRVFWTTPATEVSPIHNEKGGAAYAAAFMLRATSVSARLQSTSVWTLCTGVSPVHVLRC